MEADVRVAADALGAFGLDGDINNRFFIRKVLEGGTLTAGALATKLTDKRYAQMSAAAIERMRGHCSLDVTSERLRAFLNPDEAPSR